MQVNLKSICKERESEQHFYQQQRYMFPNYCTHKIINYYWGMLFIYNLLIQSSRERPYHSWIGTYIKPPATLKPLTFLQQAGLFLTTHMQGHAKIQENLEDESLDQCCMPAFHSRTNNIIYLM